MWDETWVLYTVKEDFEVFSGKRHTTCIFLQLPNEV